MKARLQIVEVEFDELASADAGAVIQAVLSALSEPHVELPDTAGIDVSGVCGRRHYCPDRCRSPLSVQACLKNGFCERAAAAGKS